jgi:hypothetical protein
MAKTHHSSHEDRVCNNAAGEIIDSMSSWHSSQERTMRQKGFKVPSSGGLGDLGLGLAKMPSFLCAFDEWVPLRQD